MNNIIKLVTKDSVNINNREFTRVMGGFNENSVIVTGKQVGELLGYANGDKTVNLTISRNIKSFTNEYLLDLKSGYLNDQDIEMLNSLGYSKQSISNSKNIYILSHLGLLLFLQIADIKKDYSEFISEYFEADEKLNVARIRFEHEFGNLLRTSFYGLLNIEDQYSCCNNKYRIDFYDIEKRLAIEYDEGHHANRINEDINRQKEIEEELNCNFIRVVKGEEFQGINKIITHLMNNKLESAS
jgi:very-short-patch-repair endonuclease